MFYYSFLQDKKMEIKMHLKDKISSDNQLYKIKYYILLKFSYIMILFFLLIIKSHLEKKDLCN